MSEPAGPAAARAWRLGAAGGLVFAVCTVAALVTTPPPPAADASAATVRSYLTGHHGALLAGCALAAVGSVAMLPFLVALRGRLRATPLAADTLLAGGIVTVVAGLFGPVLQAGLVHAEPRLEGSALLALFAAQRAVFYVAPPFGAAVATGAVAAAYRAGALPRWLFGLSGLLTVLAVAGGVSVLLTASTWAGGIGLAGFLVTIGWAAATAVVLLRDPSPEPAPGPRSRAAALAGG